MKQGKLKVYVGKYAHPDMKTDQKYHIYYVVEEGYQPRTALMHDEEYIPDPNRTGKGTYRRRGDYMVGAGFFDPDYCKEIQPCECSPCIIFEEYNLVREVPNHPECKYVVNQEN